MAHEVNISVRSLVEYVYSSGSIDSRFRSQSTLVDGTRAHQKIQKTYKKEDQKEVYLRAEIRYEDITFIVDGRCDGLLVDNETITIDEIKSFSKPLDQIEGDGSPVHWAQAKMYAYMYARDHQLTEISVQLTYVHLETDQKKYFKQSLTFSELELYVKKVLDMYAPYAKLQIQHQANRNQSCKELPFPFEAYREGQRKLAGAVYKTILDEKNLFAKAPTGIGKTISTLFPSVKAVGEGLVNRLFYLTAKTTTRKTAEEAFSRMEAHGLCMKSVTLTAKDKICFKEEAKCNPEYCEFANGYYDRINGAILDILTLETCMNRDVIEAYARKHQICPFEFSIDLVYSVDAIICDYNYIFDPKVALKRLWQEQKKSTVILIDEAHNLVDRGREMFSASIQKDMFLQLKKETKGIHQTIYEMSNRINSWFLSLKKAHEGKKEFILEEVDESLKLLLEQFNEAAEQVLKEGNLPVLLDTYFKVLHFLKIMEMLDAHYVIYVEKQRNDFVLNLFCIDPSSFIQQIGQGFRSIVFFSATLSPLRYYQDILGGDADDFVTTIPSPFKKEQVEVLVKPLSTRYRDREQTKEQIAFTVNSLIKQKQGNYLIFFPSYQYLMAVYEEFKKLDPYTDTILQDVGMSEMDRENFLAAFQPNPSKPLAGFTVLGGVFSEGVDLPGDRITGVMVVGVGLPQLCFERNLIKQHFDHKGKNGYNYAYVFPGMNKVQQAGGRLIRSESDHGTILLIDDRFLQLPYHALLPEEWQSFTTI
ncbi:ATP-dependent DNA helicase [Neobacillus sp. LXY-1]|uniref:ATP-dependent DNA helicase n=1 Tax=Neobacillus sp. LXY-1 TaxID=3379133 RepID=UPI003EE1F585